MIIASGKSTLIKKGRVIIGVKRYWIFRKKQKRKSEGLGEAIA
jgi:hypothetical protein